MGCEASAGKSLESRCIFGGDRRNSRRLRGSFRVIAGRRKTGAIAKNCWIHPLPCPRHRLGEAGQGSGRFLGRFVPARRKVLLPKRGLAGQAMLMVARHTREDCFVSRPARPDWQATVFERVSCPCFARLLGYRFSMLYCPKSACFCQVPFLKSHAMNCPNIVYI